MVRWSQHVHSASECKKTITIDGCWKIYRSKCAEDTESVETDEFRAIQIGCKETPMRKSYFCKKHIDCKIKVKEGDKIKLIKPDEIKISVLGN